MTTAAEGTTMMVAAIVVGGKGKQRRMTMMVVAATVGGKGDRKIKVIS